MATEVTRLRDRGIMPDAPRVVGAKSNMATAATAIADRYGDQPTEQLRILDKVHPLNHGVIAVRTSLFKAGEVLVYNERAAGMDDLVEGAIYVAEYQRPRAGLPPHMWASTPDFRMEVTHEIVVIRRHSKLDHCWTTTPVRQPKPGHFVFTDGPYEAIHLADRLIGRVVGIYQPAAFAVAS